MTTGIPLLGEIPVCLLAMVVQGKEHVRHGFHLPITKLGTMLAKSIGHNQVSKGSVWSSYHGWACVDL